MRGRDHVPNLDVACELVRGVVHELERGMQSKAQLRARLVDVASRVLDLLEDDEGTVVDELQRQSRDIAEDLRRAQDLIRRRQSGEL